MTYHPAVHGELAYAFRHALLREAACERRPEGLTFGTKAILHHDMDRGDASSGSAGTRG